MVILSADEDELTMITDVIIIVTEIIQIKIIIVIIVMTIIAICSNDSDKQCNLKIMLIHT